jgi:hypothetical protein
MLIAALIEFILFERKMEQENVIFRPYLHGHLPLREIWQCTQNKLNNEQLRNLYGFGILIYLK